MRVIPISCLVPGMTIAKNIYGPNGEIMLKNSTVLTSRYISRLFLLGYNGVYIYDKISEDIECTDIIDENLRRKTVSSLSDIFKSVNNDKRSIKQKIKEVSNLVNNILENLLENRNLVYNMIDLKAYDDYTFYHCVNVAVLAITIGIECRYTKDEIYQLAMGAVMHDIGKVFISINILNKPGKLNTDEYNIIKMHAQKGYDYLEESNYLPREASLSVLMHHERFDGTGYPNKLDNTQINPFARIMSICDVYDAITSKRPYREAFPPFEAIEYIMANSGLMFDPAITDVFLKKICPYPNGTIVELYDKRKGIIVENNDGMCLRPKIRIFNEENKEVSPYIIDLSSESSSFNVTISKIIKM